MNALSHYSAKTFGNALLHFDIHSLGLHVLNWYRKPRAKQYLQKFIELENSYKGHHGDKCVCVTQWEGRIFKKEWFEDVIEYEFEDTTKSYEENIYSGNRHPLHRTIHELRIFRREGSSPKSV